MRVLAYMYTFRWFLNDAGKMVVPEGLEPSTH